MLVRDVMTKKVLTIAEEASFEQIVRLLLKKKISGVPVVNKKGKLVGIISEKDLLYQLFPSQKKFYKDIEYYKNFEKIELESAHIGKLTAKHIMTKKVVTVGPDEHVLVACSLMVINSIRRLPVVEDGRILGIVSTSNLYRNYLSHFFSK